MQITPEVQEWAAEERRLEAVKRDPLGHGLAVGEERLHNFQQIASARMTIPGGFLLLDDTGVGKSVETLAALNANGPDALPALLVCTRTLKIWWSKRVPEWVPGAVPYVVSGTATRRKKILEAAAQDPKAVVIINWEALRLHSRLAGYGSMALTDAEKAEKDLNAFEFRTVIADEAHRAKTPHAKQTRALWHLRKKARWRWSLTATVLANEYVDAWSQLHFAFPEEFPSRSQFIDRYVQGYQAPWGFQPTGLRPENKAELFWFWDFNSIRRVPDEVPEIRELIPPVQHFELPIELTAKQATAYKSMKKEMISLLDGGALAATDALIKLGRMRYIASAMPVVEEGRVIALEKPSNKIDALKELLSDGAPMPAVVFLESKKLARLVWDELAPLYRVGKITGDENEAQRNLFIEQFQNGDLDVMICNAAGAEGITLTAGRSMIFVQHPVSLIAFKQMLGRVPRIGNEADIVLCYHLVSEGTVDETVYNLVTNEKSARLEEIVRDQDRLKEALSA